jgi:glycosyltransferase involved in cell wall biosynthesis
MIENVMTKPSPVQSNSASRPQVRIYLFAYRRNLTLQRAVSSLLAQDYQDWICELHNDDPNDTFPEQLLEKVNDPRIVYVHHDRNLGPVGSFNLAFRPVSEPFISILEDDNWWEPNLLSTLLEVANRYPEASLVWANMRLWHERDDDTWQERGKIWSYPCDPETVVFSRFEPKQICGALHSNGAMVVRTSADTMFTVPESLPFFAIEFLRERRYPRPIVLVTAPLANFALTKATARRETADENLQILVLMALSVFQCRKIEDNYYRLAWAAYRDDRHKLRAIVFAAWLAGRWDLILRLTRACDLAMSLMWIARHPFRAVRAFKAREYYPDVYRFLMYVGPGKRCPVCWS